MPDTSASHHEESTFDDSRGPASGRQHQLERRFTAGADTAVQVALGYQRYVATRPIAIIVYCLLVVGALVVAALLPDGWGWLLVIALPFAIALAVIRAPRRQAQSMARNLRRSFGLDQGQQIVVGLDDHTLRIASAHSESRVDYSLLAGCIRSGGAVLLKYRDTPAATLLPGAMISASDLAVINDRIRSAQHHP